MEQKTHKNANVRMDLETYEKVRMIALDEGRTISGQILYWLKRDILRYEAKHGNQQP